MSVYQVGAVTAASATMTITTTITAQGDAINDILSCSFPHI